MAQAADASKPAAPVVVVILPADKRVNDQLTESMVELKNALRGNLRLQVLGFSPDAPSFIVAARSADVDLKKLSNDQQRQALAQSLGAKVWVRVGNDRHDSENVIVAVFDASSGNMVSSGGTAGVGGSPASLTVQQAARLVIGDALSLPSAQTPTASLSPSVGATANVLPPLPPAPQVATPAPASEPNAPSILPTSSAVPAPAHPGHSTGHVPLDAALPASASSAPTGSSPIVVPMMPIAVAPPLPTATPQPPPAAAAEPEPTPSTLPPGGVPIRARDQILPDSKPAVNTAQPRDQGPATQQNVTTGLPTNSSSTPPQTADTVASKAAAAPPPTIAAAVPVPKATAAPMQPTEDSSVGTPRVKPPTPLDAATQALLDQGDAAMARSDSAGAVDAYRNAVNESPLNAAPRVRLAQAYLAGESIDSALSELERAVAIDPQSAELSAFLHQAQEQRSIPGVDVLVLTVNAASKPGDQQTQLALGDAYWNSKNLVLAEKVYLQAARDAKDASQRDLPYARLARLYAATQRYSECLKALTQSRSLGYTAALRIIQQQSDNMLGSIDSGLQQFSSGAITRTQLYDQLRSLDSQASSYASFLGKVTPPDDYRISYLHRKLAANLIAQMTPNLLNYALTAQTSYLSQSQSLEHDALTEIGEANSADHLRAADNGKSGPS